MDPKRLVRAGTPAEVSIGAVIVLLLGIGCLLWAAFPMAEGAPRGECAAIGLAGIALGVALLVAGPRVSPFYLHLTIALVTVLRGVMVATAVTERGLMLSALGYIWTAVYVAFFFRPVLARAHALFMTASLAAGMLLARAPTAVSVWATLAAMIWVSVAILSRLNASLRAEAQTDGLTGLLNRTGFALAAARERAAAQRRGEPVALALVDLDHFKVVNDRRGHAAGDRLLVDLARVWTASLRPGDVLGRFGGDEFVVMLSGATGDQAHDVLTRLARAHPAPWTAGVVLCSEDESLEQAIDRADARLYAAKEARRSAVARSGQASAVPSWHPAPPDSAGSRA